MVCIRFCSRNARRVLTSLLGLSLINVLYVIFRFEWIRDDAPIEFLNNDVTFLQAGQSDLACAHPELELWPGTLREMFELPLPLTCNKAQENWIYIDQGTFRFTEDVLERHGKPLCEAVSVLRGADDFTVVNGNHVKPIEDGTPLKSDFSEIKCVGPTGDVFASLLSGIAYNDTIHNRPIQKDAFKRTSYEYTNDWF